MKILKINIRFLAFVLLLGCENNHSHQSLPILGNRTLVEKQVDGKTITDTLYATVPPFFLLDQNGDSVTNQLVSNKMYVADFFFTTCPTICPVMKKQLLRVYEKYKGDPGLMILSHTIDPDHDTLAVLKDYGERLGSDGKQWRFLWGDREQIYELAEQGYYATAMPDSTEPGGFVHSGGLILVDGKGRVRGVYNGTDEKEVDHLLLDIDLLKREP